MFTSFSYFAMFVHLSSFYSMKIILTLIVVDVILHSFGCLANETNFVCPVDKSDGIYPNCTCRHKNFDYSVTLNDCFSVCPDGSDGYWPNCECESGGYFDKKEFRCITCPVDIPGQYPNCICNDDDAGFDKFANNCKKCEDGSHGKFPNCICSDGATYERDTGHCVQITCPLISDGVYPKCVCRDPQRSYIVDSNSCLACPFVSSGEYPNCKCRDENLTYSVYFNECHGSCPENSHGIEPNCKCDDGYYYDGDAEACKSTTGRKCPADSIGIGPDCLCVSKNMKFDLSSWSCINLYGGGGHYVSLLGLDCVLRSCVG